MRNEGCSKLEDGNMEWILIGSSAGGFIWRSRLYDKLYA